MNILQKLKDGANRATEKAQHVVEVNKLNSQISEIEQQKNSYYLQMGKVFYEGYRLQDMTMAEKEMVELAQTCDGLQEQMEAIRNRIAVLKNERVCDCGRVVALDANFCPYCGNKLANLIHPEKSASDEPRSLNVRSCLINMNMQRLKNNRNRMNFLPTTTVRIRIHTSRTCTSRSRNGSTRRWISPNLRLIRNSRVSSRKSRRRSAVTGKNLSGSGAAAGTGPPHSFLAGE